MGSRGRRYPAHTDRGLIGTPPFSMTQIFVLKSQTLVALEFVERCNVTYLSVNNIDE
jgi:hypothetical protein